MTYASNVRRKLEMAKLSDLIFNYKRDCSVITNQHEFLLIKNEWIQVVV